MTHKINLSTHFSNLSIGVNFCLKCLNLYKLESQKIMINNSYKQLCIVDILRVVIIHSIRVNTWRRLDNITDG